jgi:hypothetical protein
MERRGFIELCTLRDSRTSGEIKSGFAVVTVTTPKLIMKSLASSMNSENAFPQTVYPLAKRKQASLLTPTPGTQILLAHLRITLKKVLPCHNIMYMRRETIMPNRIETQKCESKKLETKRIKSDVCIS